MDEISMDLFMIIMADNELDPIEQVARGLCRMDGFDPDGEISVKRQEDKEAPPFDTGWKWYVGEAEEMLARHKTGTPPA